MLEQSNINFFKVTRCGYYTGRGDGTPRFGGLEATMTQLEAWANNLPYIAQRKTYEAAEDSETLATYLMDIRAQSGIWLVTLWNETPTADGSYAAVSMDAALGDSDIILTPQPANSIPGYATYFMVIPAHDYVAGVRFARPIFNHRAFQQYLLGFLFSRSPHVVTQTVEVDGELQVQIAGYTETPGQTPQNLVPRFKSYPHRLPGQRDLLLAHVDDIQRVFRKVSLTTPSPVKRRLYQSLLRQLGFDEPPAANPKTHISYQVDTTLTLGQLRTVLAAWDEEPYSSSYDDVGFALKGDMGKVHWLSHANCKTDWELDVVRENAEIIRFDSLLDELVRNSAAIMRAAGA